MCLLPSFALNQPIPTRPQLPPHPPTWNRGEQDGPEPWPRLFNSRQIAASSNPFREASIRLQAEKFRAAGNRIGVGGDSNSPRAVKSRLEYGKHSGTLSQGVLKKTPTVLTVTSLKLQTKRPEPCNSGQSERGLLRCALKHLGQGQGDGVPLRSVLSQKFIIVTQRGEQLQLGPKRVDLRAKGYHFVAVAG